VIFKKLFSKLLCICLLLEKLVNEKHFSIKEKFSLVFRKVFFFILDGKYFLKIIKKLKISYYLLIISNLVLKLFVFQFHPLKLNFYINFILYF